MPEQETDLKPLDKLQPEPSAAAEMPVNEVPGELNQPLPLEDLIRREEPRSADYELRIADHAPSIRQKLEHL